eukprot:scaffold54648_cov20-Tisochrysis_lutea.AAC.1
MAFLPNSAHWARSRYWPHHTDNCPNSAQKQHSNPWLFGLTQHGMKHGPPCPSAQEKRKVYVSQEAACIKEGCPSRHKLVRLLLNPSQEKATTLPYILLTCLITTYLQLLTWFHSSDNVLLCSQKKATTCACLLLTFPQQEASICACPHLNPPAPAGPDTMMPLSCWQHETPDE